MLPALLGSVPSLLGEATPLDTFLLAHPRPSSSNVADLLKAYSPASRGSIAQALISRGVEAKTVSAALSWLEASEKIKSNWPKVVGVLSITSAAVSAFHGYRRNQSIGWAVWWFFMGSLFPVFTPVIAVSQGFGQKKS